MRDDPFDAAVARQARYEQAVSSAKDWGFVVLIVVTFGVHALVAQQWTGWLLVHLVVAALTASGAAFAWFHDDVLGRQPVLSRWRNVVFVRRPGPRP